MICVAHTTKNKTKQKTRKKKSQLNNMYIYKTINAGNNTFY